MFDEIGAAPFAPGAGGRLRPARPHRPRVAVVGSGISGLAAAVALSQKFQVTLFEAANRLGGHSNTVDVDLGDRSIPVDTGFIVYNEATYPNLTALFDWLGVATAPSDMSFAASIPGGPEYAASSRPGGLFADRRNLIQPQFLGMVRDILRFQRDMRRRLAAGDLGDVSLGDVLAAGRYGRPLRDHYLVPMAAAVWSATPGDVLAMPAEAYLRFCRNHGMLTMTGRPQWRTVVGGSREYVRRLAARLTDIQSGAPVLRVRRHSGGVMLAAQGRPPERFDHVVLATHADKALALLDRVDTLERQVLGDIRYRPNRAWLHRDSGAMPRRRQAWSSWNYVGVGEGPGQTRADGAPAAVTYWMNRLQPLATGENIFVSLNPAREPRDVDACFDYAHPMFDRAALVAQRALHQIQGAGNVWYCGAWCGYGFHEDGLVSAQSVARWLGAEVPWAPTSADADSANADRVPMAACRPACLAFDKVAA